MIAQEVMDSFGSNQLVAVFHYNDVTCKQWQQLRGKLAKYQVKLKVVPARLSSKVSFCCSLLMNFIVPSFIQRTVLLAGCYMALPILPAVFSHLAGARRH